MYPVVSLESSEPISDRWMEDPTVSIWIVNALFQSRSSWNRQDSPQNMPLEFWRVLRDDLKVRSCFLVIVGISSLIKKNPVKLRISWQIYFRRPIAMPAYSLIRCIILFRYLFINDTILPVPYIHWHPDISVSLQFLFYLFWAFFRSPFSSTCSRHPDLYCF